MTDQFADAPNPDKAQRMLDNIRARYARGQEALRAEQDNPDMTTRRFAEEQRVPPQHIRRDKQFAEVFTEKQLDEACRLRQPDGMPLQWGHLNKVFALPTSKERMSWLKKAAKNGWPADVLSRQITGETGHRGAYGRAIKRPYSVEDGLSQLVRDGELWLRRLEVVVEFINEKSDAESAGKNVADALEGLLESVATKKQRKALFEDLRPVVEELGDVLMRMRSVCTPQTTRELNEHFAKP